MVYVQVILTLFDFFRYYVVSLTYATIYGSGESSVLKRKFESGEKEKNKIYKHRI